MTRGRGGCSFESLRPPVTSGPVIARIPSKPCHIWGPHDDYAFKTLSHLGSLRFLGPSKPCHIWEEPLAITFKTLSHLGCQLIIGPSKPCHIWVTWCTLIPSKPCHIWAFPRRTTFKTLSHLGLFTLSHLQNPVTSGLENGSDPSKPCHIWETTINRLWCKENSE